MPKKHLSEKKCIWILYIFCICLFALTGCDGTPSGEKNESSSQSSSAKNEFSVPSTDEEIIPDTPVAASPSVDAKGSRKIYRKLPQGKTADKLQRRRYYL